MTYFDLKLMFKTDLFFTFYFIAPKNGMIDMFRQFSQGDNQDSGKSVYVPDPDLLGQSDPIGILPLKEHATLVYIYQDPTTNETAFHPVQADQHCHR